MQNTQINTGLQEFRFTDNSGKVFASFFMNPGDLNVAKRFDDAARFFAKNRGKKMNLVEFTAFNRVLEKKVAAAIGCKRDDIFGKVPAATVLPDGDFFVAKVLKVVSDAVRAETARRRKVRMDAVNKYAGKYDADPAAGLAPGQKP